MVLECIQEKRMYMQEHGNLFICNFGLVGFAKGSEFIMQPFSTTELLIYCLQKASKYLFNLWTRRKDQLKYKIFAKARHWRGVQ